MFKTEENFYFLLLSLFFLALLIFVNVSRAEGFIVSEIMYDPLGADEGNEWIEIFNNTSSSINITSDIKLNNGSNHILSVYNGNSEFLSKNFFVITTSANNFLNKYSSFSAPLFESSFVLSNSSGFVKLLQGSNILAEQSYNSSIGGNGNGKSIERGDLNSSENIWRESIENNGNPGQAPSVVSQNIAPQAVMNISTTTTLIGNNISFDASSSSDANGDTLSYLWNIGSITSSTNKIFDYSFSNPGFYNISLKVSDGNLESETSAVVNILENNTDTSTSYVGKIVINELLPNPEGDDDTEWIELKNISSNDIDLKDFVIQDESERQYFISLDDFSTTTIKAGGFFVVDYSVSNIILNNTGDKISLYDNYENKISEVTYTSSKEGQSFAKFGDTYQWTKSLSKGLENVLEQEATSNNSTIIINNSSVSKVEEKDFCDTNSLNRQILISEVLPNPDGVDDAEFVEIYNPNSFEIDLTNWKLKDLSSSSYKFSEKIKANSYIAIFREDSKISLNNSKEEIFLYDCKGTLVSNLKYEKSFKGQSFSYNLVLRQYEWTSELSPGFENVFKTVSDDIEDLKKIVETPTSTISSAAKINLNLENDEYVESSFKDLEKNQSVYAYAVVIALPNKIANNAAYVCNYDSKEKIVDYYDCISLYFNGAWSSLKIGSVINFNGKFMTSATVSKIKLSKKEDLKIIGYEKLNSPDNVLIENIDEGILGSYISMSGTISKLNKKSIIIKSDEAEFKIKILDKNFNSSLFKKDENIVARGIVSKEKENYILLIFDKGGVIENKDIVNEDENKEQVLGEKEVIDISSDNKKNEVSSFFDDVVIFFKNSFNFIKGKFNRI